MPYRLKEVDQNFRRGYTIYSLLHMSFKFEGYIDILLIIYSPKPKEAHQELQGRYMSISLLRYVLKAQGGTPGAPRRIYEYIPY